MKAIVNIGLRSVELQYYIEQKNLFPYSQEERNRNFIDWELFQKNKKSKILCKHTLRFKDIDEWQSSTLFDGRMIDFHFDYEPLKSFNNKKEWLSYIMQGYLYIEGQEQQYETQVINTVKIEL